MKKAVIFLLIFSLSFSVGCKSENENGCAEIIVELSENKSLVGDYLIYTDCRDISNEGYISPEKLGYLYYGEKQQPTELSALICFCICINKSKECSEIHILKVKNKSDTFSIERMLKTRAEFTLRKQINQNDSDFLTQPPSAYQIKKVDNFVIMCIGNNSDILCKKISKII